MNPIEIMQNSQLAEWFINIAIKSVIVLCFGWMVLYLTKNRRAPLLSRISLFVMLALLILPFIPSVSETVQKLSLESVTGEFVIYTDPMAPGAQPHILNGTHAESSFTTYSAFNAVFWLNLLGAVWICGFVFKLSGWLRQLWSVRRFKQQLTPMHIDGLDSLYKRLHRHVMRKRPRVYLSGQNHSPLVFGILNPIIVLPNKLIGELNERELNAVMAHELSHIARKDHLTGILQQLLISFYWWNPILYRINRVFTNSSEYICDNYAIFNSGAGFYARTLLHTVTKTKTDPRVTGSIGINSAYQNVSTRIKTIIQKERKMETKIKTYLSLSIFSVTLLLFGLVASQNIVFADRLPDLDKRAVSPERPDADAAGEKNPGASHQNKTEEYTRIAVNGIKKTHHVEPVYPADVIDENVKGTVVLELSVNRKGQVSDIRLVHGHPRLNDATIKAVKQWRYAPYVRNGKALPVKLTIVKARMGKRTP